MAVAFNDVDFESRCLFSCRSERARYVLFLVSVPYLETLPHFTDSDASFDVTLNKRDLRWVPADSLMRAVSARRSTGTTWSSDTDLAGVGKIAPFIFHMLRSNCAVINRRLQNRHTSEHSDQTREELGKKSSRRRRDYFSSQR